MRRIALALSASLVMFVVTTASAAALGSWTPGSTGVDVSWPNCSTSIPSATFGIVGVNDGTGYSQNPCLAAEARRFGNLGLYVNTGWYAASSHINPSSPRLCATGDENCLAYNYGYNAGEYALGYSTGQGVRASSWWLDVETGNTWSTDVIQNRNSLQGEHDALAAAGVTTIGVYSTTAQWDTLTGSWLNGWPSWGATTWTTARQAQTYCHGHEFTGGRSYLMQYTPRSSNIDHDVAC